MREGLVSNNNEDDYNRVKPTITTISEVFYRRKAKTRIFNFLDVEYHRPHLLQIQNSLLSSSKNCNNR